MSRNKLLIQKSSHLFYLDGLRGLTALYVVFHHAYMEVRATSSLPSLVLYLTNWLYYGQVAVDIFIVLSGYCLMMPVALSNGHLRGGIIQYLLRRSRRILPPYYLALLLSLLSIVIFPSMNQMHGVRWDYALPAFRSDIIISHLLLIHNLKDDWIYKIDPPMWSVATEWQIYFLFPILLLPIWRNFGNVATVLVSFALGMAPHFLMGAGDSSCPWFLGLFSLGMVAAAINAVDPDSLEQQLKWFKFLGAVNTIIFVLIACIDESFLWNNRYVMDLMVGISISCLLIYFTTCCYYDEYSSHSPILKFMASRYPVILGTFSYSLYLVHFPILSLLQHWLALLELSATNTLICSISIGTSLSLLVGLLFHLLWERRFIKKIQLPR